MTLLPNMPQGNLNQPQPYRPGPQPPAVPPSEPHSRTPLIVATILVVILLAGAFAYYAIVLKKSAPQVSLEVTAPERVFMGEKFDLDVSYGNASKDSLLGAKISVTLPEGIVLYGAPPDKRFDEEDLGDIASGMYGKRTVSFVSVSGANTVKHIPVKLRYTLQGSGPHEYDTTITKDVAIGPAAIAVNFNTPQSVASGQKFDVSLGYQNTSTSTFQNVRLTVQYPSVFIFGGATSSPVLATDGNSAFTIGTLAPTASGSITIAGVATGAAANFALPAKLMADIGGQTYTLWNAAPAISLSQAPLTLALFVNGAPDFVAHVGNDLRYSVRYKNTSQTTFQNVTVQLKLASQFLDMSRLVTKGTFDSRANTISWNSTNAPELGNVAPGTEGVFEFNVPIVATIPIRRASDKNFAVHAEGTIQSPTVPTGTEAAQTISLAALDTKIGGDIALQALAYYTEPTRLVKNSGPYPLQANKTTRFTIHWKLQNAITDMQGVRVSAKLGSGVKWTNVATSTQGDAPLYNSQNGMVSWNVPRIAAGEGVLDASPEAIFQIEVTPAINQVGNQIDFISDSGLSATDAFTGQGLDRTAGAVNSYAPGKDGRVGP
jgi:hypothetical protein